MEGASQRPTLYLNENIATSLVPLLAGRGIAAIRTRDVGNLHLSDQGQLDYASKRGYVLVTHNRRDFVELHETWTKRGKSHPGIIVIDPAEPEVLANRLYVFISSIYPTVRAPFCLSPP